MKKNTLRKFKSFMAVILMILALGGCANYQGNETKLALVKTIDPKPAVFSKHGETEDMKLLKKVEKEILSIHPIYDAAIVKTEKETVVAYKVKHMHRFRMKQIEKQINQRLEKKFPDERFTVSSDYKIFLEVVELINKQKDPKYSPKEADKKLKEIISLKQELT